LEIQHTLHYITAAMIISKASHSCKTYTPVNIAHVIKWVKFRVIYYNPSIDKTSNNSLHTLSYLKTTPFLCLSLGVYNTNRNRKFGSSIESWKPVSRF